MRSPVAFLIAALLLTLAGQPAWADKRVALVIGNANYTTAGTLKNPVSDATAIGEMLRHAQFDVVETRQNLNNTDMRRALRDFSAKAREADYAIVYYAGHGIEVEGTNYLLPVDVVLDQDSDATTKLLRSIACCRRSSPRRSCDWSSSMPVATTRLPAP